MGKQSGARPSTYGEITPIGLRQIARATNLDDLDGHAVLMDLGSGVGKLVAQAFLEWPGVIRAVGIEMFASRTKRARDAWNAVVSSGEKEALRSSARSLAASSVTLARPENEEIIFVQGDLFE